MPVSVDALMIEKHSDRIMIVLHVQRLLLISLFPALNCSTRASDLLAQHQLTLNRSFSLHNTMALLLRDIRLPLSQWGYWVPLFTIWDSVAGPGRTPLSGNNSGRTRPGQ